MLSKVPGAGVGMIWGKTKNKTFSCPKCSRHLWRGSFPWAALCQTCHKHGKWNCVSGVPWGPTASAAHPEMSLFIPNGCLWSLNQFPFWYKNHSPPQPSSQFQAMSVCKTGGSILWWVTSTGSEVRLPGFLVQLHYLLARWSWTSGVTSLNFSFIICTLGIRIFPIS